jgi:hypothetical protein
MVEEAQYRRRKKVEMIEAGTILAGASILALALVAGLLARRPAKALVTLRIRNKK